MQVTHKLFWTRYFFKVHLIELQENRRQILKKRAAEVASKNENEENNWDDVADLADNPTSNTIPAEVQEKLLSEYEKELIGEKYNYANVILFWITHPWVRYPKEIFSIYSRALCAFCLYVPSLKVFNLGLHHFLSLKKIVSCNSK